jgi:hypothetical protein
MFDIEQDFAHLSGWSVGQIEARIAEIGGPAERLTEEERAEMHALKLALPSQGQLVSEARERVQQRVSERRERGRARVAEAAAAYKDTEWMSAVDKALVVEDFTRLVQHVAEHGTSREMPASFTVRVYEHISNHCGHIAHYDRSGFWHAQLSTSQKALSFFEGMASQGMVAWSVHDYRDVNTALSAAAKARMDALKQVLQKGVRTEALQAIEALALAAGIEVTVGGRQVKEAVAMESGPAQAALF